MTKKEYKGIPYHLWNPFTPMEDFLPYLEIGPMVITRGEGPYVYNDQGKRYINGSSSLWNVAVGHGRKELVEAAARQMAELAYASCFRQVHPRAIELAARLVEITGNKYDWVYLDANGSEAIETAIKITRQYHVQAPDEEDRGKLKIISLYGSYHGVSYGALSTSGLATDKEKFGPLVPGFVQIKPPYCYRCPYNKPPYPDCGIACARALEEAILKEGPETVGAFILEPVMGVFGIVAAPDEYYDIIGEICRKYKVLLIADEITTGFGRTGKLFASQDWKISPDILCLGKGISSGYLPLSATLVTGNIYEHFREKGQHLDHGCTASGHPVCAAVGLKNIEIILAEKLPENAAQVGTFLQTGLRDLARERSIIGDVRGKGLMLAIELVKDKETKEPLDDKKMFEIVIDIAALGMIPYYHGNFIGLWPPLIINRSLAGEIVEIMAKALDMSKIANFSKKNRMMREIITAKMGKAAPPETPGGTAE